jgi:hypothetical protein
MVWQKFTDFSEVLAASETSVNLYQTAQRNNPEDNHGHTRRRENLKSSYDCGLC